MSIRRIATVLFLMMTMSAAALAQTYGTGSGSTYPSVSSGPGPYQIIVQCSYGTDVNKVAAAYGGKVVDYLYGSTWLMNVSSLPTVVPQGVVYAEVNLNVSAGNISGWILSTSASSDWYRKQPAMKLIRADAASLVSTGRGVVVADINSLIDYSHPSLAGHLTGGYDFVLGSALGATLNQSSTSFLDQSSASFLDQSSASFLDQSTTFFLDQSSASFLDQSSASFLDTTNPAHGHGTLVAGIIAGMAPQAMIMPLRAFDDHGSSDVFTITKAIYWAVQHGAHVINMSFGTMEYSRTMKNAIDYANSANVVLVASAGNNNTSSPQYPAAFDKVLTVAATDLYDRKASFSNYGRNIFVDAPGVNIISTYPGGYYAIVSGTSFSAPMAAAEAALMKSLNGSFSKSDMANGTVDIEDKNPRYEDGLGEGRIDVLSALRHHRD